MHASLILKKEKSCHDNYCICCAAVVASRQIVARNVKRVVACRQIVAQNLMTVVASRQIVAQDLKAVVASRQIVAQDLKAVVAWQATTNYCICTGCEILSRELKFSSFFRPHLCPRCHSVGYRLCRRRGWICREDVSRPTARP